MSYVYSNKEMAQLLGRMDTSIVKEECIDSQTGT